MFKVITYVIVGILLVIFFSIVVIRRKQSKRMEEARMRGIKTALREQKQYEALRKVEGKENMGTKEVNDKTGLIGRREIKR